MYITVFVYNACIMFTIYDFFFQPIKSPVVPTSKKVTITKEFDFAGETVK